MVIKVLLADDHQVVRMGLVKVLQQAGIEIVGEASEGSETIEKTRTLQPDVLVADVLMPGRDGLFALEELRDELPQQNVIMLSMYNNPTYVARALALGAKDFILKSQPMSDLIDSIKCVARGEIPVGNQLVQKVRQKLDQRARNSGKFNTLTNREMQVLRHVAYGLSNREIGKSLTISVETVKEHVQNILRKVDVTDRTQAAVWAVRNNLV